MCKFKSAIVLRDESRKGGFDLKMSPWTESHSELIQFYNIKDGARLTFARVEFSPESMETAHQPETYKLSLDEERTPEWWTDEIRDAVAERMRNYIRAIVVDGAVALLMGGQFILAPSARVEACKACVITAMLGSSQVGTMWGSSQVGTMWGSSQVGEMRGSSQVGTMWGSSQVGTMRGSSQVGTMLDSSQVSTMLGGSRIDEMWGASQVGTMWGSSQAPKSPTKDER